MKASELREMSDEQLGVLLRETTEQWFRLRLQAQTEKLDAPSELRKHRRLIAQIKTVQHQRGREASAAAAAAEAALGAAPPAAAEETKS